MKNLDVFLFFSLQILVILVILFCKFKPQYVGMTKRRICDRFNEHFSINSKSTNTGGIQFSATNHSSNNFEMVPIKQVYGFCSLEKNTILENLFCFRYQNVKCSCNCF